MQIGTTLPDFLTPACRAYYIKRHIEGQAAGVAPLLLIHPVPALYKSGVVFRAEPTHGAGVEDFALPWFALARGWVDCDDAALWRCAELLAEDEPATIRADYLGGELHVYVRRGSAGRRYEDPSLVVLGIEQRDPATIAAGLDPKINHRS